MRTRSFLTLGALALTIMLGCENNAESPTTPAAEPASLASAAAPTLVFRQISVGTFHICAVTTDDRAYCWGHGFLGELGNGTTRGDSVHPNAVVGGHRFRSVSAGQAFSCGVTTGDAIYCWGNNFWGQLGDGTVSGRPYTQPVRVASGIRFRAVSAGNGHTCAVSIGDIVFCWGLNAHGELGDGTTTDRLLPTRPVGWGHFSTVSAGDLFSCGVTTASRAYCWGYNGWGQLGDGSRTQQLRPTAVAGGLAFDQVEMGALHACGVTTDHRGYCWGSEFSPNGTLFFYQTPTLVSGGLRFRSLDASAQYTCGVTTVKGAYCWGHDVPGSDSVDASLTPMPVAGGLRFRQVSTGPYFACGITIGDRTRCWGQPIDVVVGPTPTPIAGVR